MKALLRLKIYTCSEIGAMVGRSADAVEKVAKLSKLPLVGQSKKTEEYKQRLAIMFGDLSEKMLDSLAKSPDKALEKTSIAQRAMVAGIATDKMLALTKTKEEEQQTINLSWVQLVQQSTPGRRKDNSSSSAPPAIDVEEAKIVEPAPSPEDGDKDFLE